MDNTDFMAEVAKRIKENEYPENMLDNGKSEILIATSSEYGFISIENVEKLLGIKIKDDRFLV